MRHSFISYLFLGFFLLSLSSVHAQSSWQFYGGTEFNSSKYFNNLQQYSIGTEYQFPLGNRIVIGTGAAANIVDPGRSLLRSNRNFGSPNVNSFEPLDSQTLDWESGGFSPVKESESSFSFSTRAYSVIRLDMPLYFGIRLGEDSSLPFLLKLGALNEFARVKILSSSGITPDGITYGLSSFVGIQIPIYRGKEIGFSMEPYFTYGRNIDFRFWRSLNLNAQVHSFGLRFSTHIL